MDINKLLNSPDNEEVLVTATEPLRLTSLTVTSRLNAEKIATLVRQRDTVFDTLASFTLGAGGFQRNVIGLLPESFQLEAGQSLLIRLSPDFNDSEEYIGISGFAYTPNTGGLPGDLTTQLTAITGAIDDLDTTTGGIPITLAPLINAITAAVINIPANLEPRLLSIETAIGNISTGSGGGSGGAATGEAFFAALAQWLKTRSNGWTFSLLNLGNTIPIFTSNVKETNLAQSITFGDFQLGNRLWLFIGGGLTTRPELKLYELRDLQGNLLDSGQCSSLSSTNDNNIHPTFLDTSAFAGTLAQLTILDNDTTVSWGQIQIGADFWVE